MRWIKILQSRWKIGSALQVVIILVVFACTGFTVLLVRNPLLRFFFGESLPQWARVLYWIVILPIYNIVLLFYGFVFGQFRFFWTFEKNTFQKLKGLFTTKETNT